MNESILILDDDPNMRENLERTFRRHMPDVRVDSTAYLKDAIGKAREANTRGDSYALACLDVMLPISPSEPKEDLHPARRRELLAALKHGTVVINHSKFAGEEWVRQFVSDLGDPNFPRPVLVDASAGASATEEILRHARRVIFGRRISEQLDRMLQAAHSGGGRAAAPVRGRGPGGTQGFAGLIADIKLAWDDLDPELQRRVGSVFHVQKVGSDLLVNP